MCSQRLSLFLATVAFTMTVLGEVLIFGVTRSDNFSVAIVVPEAVIIRLA